MLSRTYSEGGFVAKSRKAYKGEKRQKELKRLKKQEEKRLRRQGKTVPEKTEEDS